MDTPKAASKTPPPGASSPDPSGDKALSNAKVLAAQKLDDIIEGQRNGSSGSRMERQQSRRLTSLSSRRNLMDASPSMSVRKTTTRFETLVESGNAKDPPSSTDSSPTSQSGRKEPPGRMSKTSANLQQDLEAKARARGLRSSTSERNMMGESSLSVRLGVKKAPPPSPPSDAKGKESLAREPRRMMSRGEFQPSPANRNPDPNGMQEVTSSFEVQMGGLNLNNSASRTRMSSSVSRRNSDDSVKRPGLLSQSNSVRRMPSSLFRRNNFARESSMSVLRRSATSSNSNMRDLDQLIAYKTGIPLDENQEDVEGQKPTVLEGEEVNEENGVGLLLPSPQASYAAANGSSLSGITNNRELDEMIAYKTGIPLQDDNEEDVEVTVEQVSSSPSMGKAHLLNTSGDSTAHQVAKRPELDGNAMEFPDNDKEGTYGPGGFGKDWMEEVEDLAIAIEVQDQEEDAFIPSAIEYDPDAKPPIYKNRRFRFYCLFLFGIAAVAIVSVVAMVESQPETNFEAESPFAPTEAQSIKSSIELVVGEEKLADVDGPHYVALDWITNVDKLQVGVSDTGHLIQRYIIALFHFQTWNRLQSSCGATDLLTNQTFGADEHECIYQQLHSVFPNKYRSVPSYRWLSSKHECEWAGILCDDDGNVRVIDVSGQNIRGHLPAEFAELRLLQSLMFSWNQLTGTIPQEYGNMKYMVTFEGSFNQLTGTLPAWTETRNLQLFDVGGNSLTGTIPPSFQNMVNLGGLYLHNNAFQGPIPDFIGDLTNLKYIRFNRNFFTGTVPTTLGRLNPIELTLSRLELLGPLPSELGNMVGLETLRLSSSVLNGTIPEELYNMTALKRLDIVGTSMTGTLSTNIGKMTDLRTLRINANRFSGAIPAELGDLPELFHLWMNGNEFDGAVPLEVCSLKERASLQMITADCSPMNSTGIAQTSCDCCDTCCNSETKMCSIMGE